MFMNRNVLPERMKEIRESIGLKQGEMAKRMGIARTSLCLYENGQRTPDAHVLKQFILASGVSPYYLLGLHNTKKDEYSDVFHELGLSERAIDKLREKPSSSSVLNLMLESDIFWTIIRLIDTMAEFENPENGNPPGASLVGATIEDVLCIDYEDALRYCCQKYLDEIIDNIISVKKGSFEREFMEKRKEDE